jgi:hypothetical protein
MPLNCYHNHGVWSMDYGGLLGFLFSGGALTEGIILV